MVQPILIDGRWQAANDCGTFQAYNPQTGEALTEVYPLSTWTDCDRALSAAHDAFTLLRHIEPRRLGDFLETFAEHIEQRADELVSMAHIETALPESPRLAEVELPRTTGQLRQAAAATSDGSWAMPTIDTKAGIRSCLLPLGPIVVLGPNNFPLAFNSISGGDFAAAIAAGNPVIAKANSSHPATTRMLAEEALAAVQSVGLPPATVQLLYRTAHEDGCRLVADPRVGATAYTGSRTSGLRLKAAAEKAGKPIYLELSSINPVIILPGAIHQRGSRIAESLTDSCLLGTGQFCTNPGMIVLLAGEATERFIDELVDRFKSRPHGTLLSAGVARSLGESILAIVGAGASVLAGGRADSNRGYHYENTLLRVAAGRFLENSRAFQTEAFGNANLIVVAQDVDQLQQLIERLEGNLTGCFYSDTSGADDALYDRLEPWLRGRVGRLLNDKPPTGVAVSPAMNHGGPFPSTGHPGFTAVGLPAALRRFAMLACYDNVRPERLPPPLGDKNPTGRMWRQIDGTWSRDDVPA